MKTILLALGFPSRRIDSLCPKFERRLAIFVATVAFGILPAAADTIVIYGASGNIGSNFVTEALNRGHEVIGVSRDPASLDLEHANFTAVQGDATSLGSMLGIIEGADAVILAVRGNGSDNSAEQTITNRTTLTYIEAAHSLGDSAPRVLEIGNQAVLYRNEVRGVDGSRFQDGSALSGRVLAHALILEHYRAAPNIRWTVFSPSGSIGPGERMGKYRLGGDEMLLNSEGTPSGISQADFAVAFIDEIENPQAFRKHAAVGY